jgi:hypothetical protein
MNSFPTKEEVAQLRKQYPPGIRIELLTDLQDPYTKIPAGSRATVKSVDDAGHILCAWDCGSGLNIISGTDEFKVVPHINDMVFEQIRAIRKSGKTNMFDTRTVFEIAVREGYGELADFIFSYTPYYSHFILTGQR